MSAITRRLDALQQGSGGVLFIVGEAGLGKTTALDQARRLASPSVVAGESKGDRMESRLPFAMLAQPLDAVSGLDVIELADKERALSDNRSTVFHKVLRWLEGLAPKPILLALDDLHWADQDSLDLLAFLCRRVSHLPVAVIATLRPWPRPAQEVSTALVRSGHASVERLGPLSLPAAGEILAARVGRPVPEAAAMRSHAVCDGNPLLLEHLAPALAGGDDVADLAVTVAALELDPHLLDRFVPWGPAERGFAEAASVLGKSFDPQLAAEVVELDDREAHGAVEALWHSGLVRHAEKGALEFVHPLIFHALYDALDPPQRAQLHGRAFTALAQRGAEAEAAQHGIRGNLLANPEVVAAVERAGRAALREGSTATALDLLESGVQLAGDHASPALVVALAEALLGAGRPRDATTACGEILSRPEVAVGHRLEALRTLGRALFATGAEEEAAARFVEVVRLAEVAGCKSAAVRALVDHALAAWPTGGPALTLPLALKARELASETEEVVASNAAWGLMAALSGRRAEVGAVRTMRGACLLSGQGPPSPPARLCRPWGTVGMLGLAAAWAERFDEAERALGAALEEAERLGRTDPLANLAMGYPYLLCRMGRLEEARVIVERVGALAQRGSTNEAYVDVARAWVLHQVGRFDGSGEHWARAEAGSAAVGEWAAMFLWDVQARRILQEGDVAAACRFYGVAEEATKRLGIGEPCAVPWVGHAIGAYLEYGQVDDARRVIEWVESCADPVACRWPRIVAARGLAGLAEHRGDEKAAADHLEAAMALHDQVDLPLERVETLLHFGAFLRRSGETVRARLKLGEALRVAEDCRAGWLAGQVRAELEAAGGRPRRRGGSCNGQLTPAEQRVAQLAAEGRSNREIASALVVSVATVETHLRHIFAKLNINSRRQLMMAERGARPEKTGGSRPVTDSGSERYS